MKKVLLALCAIVFVSFPATADDKGDKVKKLLEVAKPVFKTDNDELNPSAEIANDGTVTLKNRGMLVSKDEYAKGVKMSFKWSWECSDTTTYPDHLAIALRTNGTQRSDRPWEMDEAVVVRLNPHGPGRVKVEQFRQGLPGEKLTESGDVKLEQGNTYTIEVLERNNVITVKVDDKVVLEYRIDKDAGNGVRKIAIYNREPVAGVKHVSTVTDLKIEALK